MSSVQKALAIGATVVALVAGLVGLGQTALAPIRAHHERAECRWCIQDCQADSGESEEVCAQRCRDRGRCQ